MSSIDVYFFISRWAHPLVSGLQIHCFFITWLGIMFSYPFFPPSWALQRAPTARTRRRLDGSHPLRPATTIWLPPPPPSRPPAPGLARLTHGISTTSPRSQIFRNRPTGLTVALTAGLLPAPAFALKAVFRRLLAPRLGALLFALPPCSLATPAARTPSCSPTIAPRRHTLFPLAALAPAFPAYIPCI
ncbi:hypothetical protein B0H19DRAFT_1257898 [Mycena capillaripes]|nr:hypothetical protein B0H19DRAFT_1257898 [Mycena capillaripes]